MPTHAQRLIHAVRNRNHDRLRHLIGEHNDISARSPAGRTALHAAAEEGDVQAATILIGAGADVNARMHDGKTPLHQAAEYGITCDLADPDLDRRDPCRKHRRPPAEQVAQVLTDIIKEKDSNIPQDLKPSDDIPAEHKFDVFLAAMESLADIDILYREIIARGVDVDRVDPDFSEFLRGNPRFIDVARLLLDNGADVNAVDDQGCSVLRGAVEWGRPKMIELLLDRGANPNRHASGSGPEPLIVFALEHSKIDVADVLLNHGTQFDVQGYGPLHEAAANGREKALVWLLDHGANVNLRDERGNTPLLAAAGHLGVTTAILARHADVFARNQNGENALHLNAAWLPCLKEVLHLGLPMDEADGNGRTALHLAAQSGEAESIKLLMHSGASVNVQDSAGNTPLHIIFFSEEFRPDVEFPAFHALVMAGIDRGIKNAEGKTAFDLAQQWKYPDEYLKLLDPHANAKPNSFLWLGDDSYVDFLPKAMVGVELNGFEWPSCEHYFHAQKSENLEIREYIRQAKTAENAGHRMRESKVKPPGDWFSRCDSIMRSALLAKFRQHEPMRQRLLGTGEAVLISDSNCDWYWIERRGVAFNTIGKMLMDIRAELRQQ